MQQLAQFCEVHNIILNLVQRPNVNDSVLIIFANSVTLHAAAVKRRHLLHIVHHNYTVYHFLYHMVSRS